MNPVDQHLAKAPAQADVEIGRAQFAAPDPILDWVRMGDSEWCHRVGLGKFYEMLTVTTPNYEWCATFTLTMLKMKPNDEAARRQVFLGFIDRVPVLWPQPALLDYLDLRDEGREDSSTQGKAIVDRFFGVTNEHFIIRVEGLLAAIWCCADSRVLDRLDEGEVNGCPDIIIAAHRGEKINWHNILVNSFERELEHLCLNRNRRPLTRTAIGPFLTWFITAYLAQMHPLHLVRNPEPNPSKRTRIMTPDARQPGSSSVQSGQGADHDKTRPMSTVQAHFDTALKTTRPGHLTIPELMKQLAEVRGQVNCSALKITELETTVTQLRAEVRGSHERTMQVMEAVIRRMNEDVIRVGQQLVAARARIEALELRAAKTEACLEDARCILARQSGKINALGVHVQERRQQVLPTRQSPARINVLVVQNGANPPTDQ